MTITPAAGAPITSNATAAGDAWSADPGQDLADGTCSAVASQDDRYVAAGRAP